MQTKVQFTFDKVAHNKENELHLVVSLTAPKIDWQKRRAPICVIPVIDCSQSMTYHSKMEYTKQSVIKLIDHLQPGDFIGLVGFSDKAFTISPPVEVTQAQKEKLKAKVGELRPMMWTNFSDGMLMGLELGNKTDLPSGTQVRIVMFTDGQANKGFAQDKDSLVTLVGKSMNNCSVSAFGYGADAQQELLAELSKAGKGNYAFIKNPEDAMSAFGKELGGLLSTYATNIKAEISAHNSHRIVDVVSDVDVEEKDKVITLQLGDILAEETRSLVLKVKLGEQKQALPRDVNVFDVKLTYDTIGEDGKKATKTEDLKAKLRFTKEGEEQDKPTKAVDEIVALAELAKKQIEAEKLANTGQYQAAAVMMFDQAQDFGSRGLNNFANVAQSYSSSVNDAAAYSSSGGFRSSMLRSASRGSAYTVSGLDADAEVALRSLNLSVSNTSQAATAGSFNVGDIAATAAGTIVVPTDKPEPPVDPSVNISLSKSKSERW